MMQTRLAAIPCIVASTLFTAATGAHAQRCYEVIDLGTLGGERSRALAVNALGDVAGIAQTGDHPNGSNEYPRACAWFGGDPVFLTGTGISVAHALAVNRWGAVVGTTDEFVSKPFVAVGTDVQPLPLLPAFVFGEASDVNDAGVIVGTIQGHPTIAYQAMVWSGEGMTALPPPGGVTSVAEAINESGVVVGWSSVSLSDPFFRAVVWSDGDASVLPEIDPQRSSFAYDVNDAGAIVGEAYAHDGFPRAVRWVNGEIEQLAPFYSSAAAINNRGDVVGFASGHGAVLWSDGAMTALNALIPKGSEFEVLYAHDVNDARQIAATITSVSNAFHEHAALLVPTLPADVNGDNVVDFADLSAVLAAYGQAGVGLDADIDGDGVVGFADFAAVLGSFGDSCSR